MLNLREKARLALHNYRQGHPILGNPTGDDELAALGGRTRVITRHESVSPTMYPSATLVSPATATRVVPVPLYDAAAQQQQQVHPSVLEYMRTFVPVPGPAGYFAPPAPATAQFGYGALAPMSPGTAAAAGHTQYFPVFDYGPAGGEAAFPPLAPPGELAVAHSGDALLESPHSTWNAFVAGLGM
jgi:hypothetical protein